MTLAMPELLKEYGCFIGGEWRPAKDGATFETHCPADGRLLASCAEATREDVDDAVKAAWKAWESWKNVAPAERAAILVMEERRSCGTRGDFDEGRRRDRRA